MTRQYSFSDQLIQGLDQAVQTVFGSPPNERENPAAEMEHVALSEEETEHAAGLMRVNHTGEVCAQALYQGQALTAKSAFVKSEMEGAAQEENDHLAWCEERITELNSHTSYLNPLWYLGSFALGATAGVIGDKWSLGFVAETEKQVVKHLDSHLAQLPAHDKKSREIVTQMKIDEDKHATKAIEVGGVELPGVVKRVMGLMSRVMTRVAYRL